MAADANFSIVYLFFLGAEVVSCVEFTEEMQVIWPT